MNKQCLMIRTKDNRKFFTHEKNLPQLIEFSKTFNAEISIVRTEDADILDLNQLVPAICTNSYQDRAAYEVIKVAEFKEIKPESPSRRKMEIQVAKEIQEFIKKELLNGNSVTVKKVQEKYRLHISTACNHIRKVIKSIGMSVLKPKRGTYKLAN